jgi:group I intron endonuclease
LDLLCISVTDCINTILLNVYKVVIVCLFVGLYFFHGYSNFSIPSLEIIEYCGPDQLIEREKYYIKLLYSAYNIVKDLTAPPMSGQTHSEVTRQKISWWSHMLLRKSSILVVLRQDIQKSKERSALKKKRKALSRNRSIWFKRKYYDYL